MVSCLFLDVLFCFPPPALVDVVCVFDVIVCSLLLFSFVRLPLCVMCCCCLFLFVFDFWDVCV